MTREVEDIEALIDEAGGAIELILEWLDALRRRDADGVGGVFADDIVWQDLHDDTVWRSRDSVVEGFLNARDQERDVDSLELIAAPDHVVLGIRSGI